ncbi:hypothetical protein GYMLUDRAFT_243615 [Collybiopsis luxurians FD-317 M1]|uniref:Uncharacterized protein n=1 Tax=Collybiopsis luxurians FD-317 M1 TaxID=944289 RepID=A0A0D0BCM1_9AGAR|nr:hypothetical protein GYMLUDRAFT_243615 [Collybiopsis luxurians FD-317 M1]
MRTDPEVKGPNSVDGRLGDAESELGSSNVFAKALLSWGVEERASFAVASEECCLPFLIQSLDSVWFCGYSILTWYERLVWFPVLAVYLVTLVGGKNLKEVPPSEPADAGTIVSFASTIAGFVITYSPLAPDFTIYFSPNVSRVLPIAIVGSHKFYDTLMNFLGLIGYWCSAFIAVILFEHLVFRRKKQSQPENTSSSTTSPSTTSPYSTSASAFDSYRVEAWNVPHLLPSGIPAIAAGAASFGLVVPCMSQIAS